MRTLAIVTAGAIGVWLGVHAIRAFLASMVWNVAEDIPATQLALVALAVWLVGLAGWLPARVIGAGRAALVLAFLFGAAALGRQDAIDEARSGVFSIAALVAWLWWLPAYLDLAARRGAGRLVAPALVLGLAAQVGGQVALHGLDVQVLPGGLTTAVLVTVLLGALYLAQRQPATDPAADPAATDTATDAAADPAADTPTHPALGRWGAAAVMPYLFLQLTLLANVGRIQVLAGMELLAAGLLIGGGLVAAAIGMRWRPGPPLRLAVAATTAALIVAGVQGGPLTLLLVPAQAGLGVLLGAALAPPIGSGQRPRVYLATAIGGLAFFGLFFAVYYDFADSLGVVAWPLGVLIIALAGLRNRPAALERSSTSARRLLPLVAPGLIVLAGVVLAAIPLALRSVEAIPLTPPGGTPQSLRVVTYNIHQGIGRNGIANLPRTLGLIKALDADVIALQEVNRVWDLAGGVDSYSWLRSQVPLRYTAVFGPMHGVHFGNAIFSRYPIVEWGSERFALGPSGLPRGFTWAVLDTPRGHLLVTSAHLTAYDRGSEADERDGQAARLIEFWESRGRPTAAFTGDYNAEPASAAIVRTIGTGLVNARAEFGLGDAPTFHSTGNLFLAAESKNIDYVFTTPDIELLDARIEDYDASDHLAVLVELRLP